MVVKEVVTGALLLLSIVLGMAMSRRGWPLNMPLSVVHKLMSLGATVALAFLAFGKPGFMESGSLSAVLGIASLASAAVLIATGAILSGEKPNKPLKIIHVIATAVAVLCLAGAVVS